LNWLEEGYRWLRGEGEHRLSENFKGKAADLQRWNNSISKAVFQPGAKAAARQAAVAAVLAKAAAAPAGPVPLPAPADTVPLPPAGPPLSTTDTFGCARCRYAVKGCLQRCPEKALKYAAKT